MMNEYGYLKVLGRIIILLLFFIYIYSLQLKFIPFGIGTRAFLGCIGIYVWMCENFKLWSRGEFIISKKIIISGIFLFLIFFITFLSITYNNTHDITFFKYPISVLLMYFAAYLIIYCIKICYDVVSFEIVAQYITIVVTMQMLLALCMYVQPQLREFLNGLLVLSDLDKGLIAGLGGYRLIGFGAYFFGVGITNSCCLLLIAILVKASDFSFKSYFFYSLAFCIIAFLGIMMSRTTLVGILLAALLLLSRSGLRHYQLTFRFCSIYTSVIFLLFSSLFIFIIMPESYREGIYAACRFGFELFINYIQGEGLSTGSTNELITMYTFPDNFKTAMIGDGYYYMEDGVSYYKGTDVGYLRLIYYFGILGMIAYLSFQYLIIYYAKMENAEKYKLFFVMLFILMLILNLKGFTDIFSFVILFCFVQKRESVNV